MTSFQSLGIAEPLLRALATENYTTPTPIQEQAIPLVLKGDDVLGLAQTGTGKTAAFGLPLLQKLSESAQKPAPRALILAPTRELAVQIEESLRTYGRHLKLRHGVILGGINQSRQVEMLRRGVDVLVATPGRLLDLVKQKHLNLGHIEILVIDEADRMFDMGFIKDVRRIVTLVPKKRQSMLFSATMPDDVAHLVKEVLHQPSTVRIAPQKATADRIEQCVYFVDKQEKKALLTKLLADKAMSRVIVFTRTKHTANRVSEQLEKSGFPAEAIHGNKSQNARQRALDNFRTGRARILVATDIAARGIDIDNITHVVNFELPDVAESYVHRIGRTARAGGAGIAISFCDATETDNLRGIERLLKAPLTHIGERPRAADGKPDAQVKKIDYAKRRPRNRGGRFNSNQRNASRAA